MKNFGKLLCGTLIVAGLWSCSSDEPLVQETPEQDKNIPTFEGDQAVMKINIFGPSGLTRGENEGADGGSADYAPGTDSENKVSTLSFFFYDSAGDFATAVENVTYTPGGNSNDFMVEEIGQSKIVLTGLTGKNYPSYMVAILNGGDDASRLKNKSLSDIANNDELCRVAVPWTGASNGGETNFVMTSATHNDNTANGYWFATKLEDSNFVEMKENQKPGDAFDNVAAVNLYVERLASKVQLSFDGSSIGNSFTKVGEIYEMILPGDYNINGEMKKIKVQLLGWNLNGTAKKTKYFKDVNSNFKTDDGWDYSGTKRCYWSRTPNYGTNSYPPNFESVTKKYDGTNINNLSGYDAKEEKLNYINWNEVLANKFSSLTKYVRPHTDRGTNIVADGNLVHGGVTEVLIAAQIVDENNKPVSLYQLGLQFFTKDEIIPHILSSIADLNIYKKTSATTSKQIDKDDLELTFGFDGTFKLGFKAGLSNTAWYKTSECKEDEKWVDGPAVLNYINSHLPENQTYGYEDGRMYYNIPIRHLRGFGENGEIKTATYGVVRNHCYSVKVTSIQNLGHAVYRPEEDIIPPSNETRFMIGSSVRILSWRVVNQNAEL